MTILTHKQRGKQMQINVMTKTELIAMINEIPDGEDIIFEAVVGDSFNFSCRPTVFINNDDGDWRFRLNGDSDWNMA